VYERFVGEDLCRLAVRGGDHFVSASSTLCTLRSLERGELEVSQRLDMVVPFGR
jgi:hypothetical protein